MRRLLAVAVVGSWEGGWQPVQGNERAAVAAPIGEGEEVRLEVEKRVDGLAVRHHYSLSAGPLILEVRDWIRYRVVKECNGGVEAVEPTTVEMILNG